MNKIYLTFSDYVHRFITRNSPYSSQEISEVLTGYNSSFCVAIAPVVFKRILDASGEWQRFMN